MSNIKVGDTRVVMDILVHFRLGDSSSNLYEAVYISYSANLIGKCMKPTIKPDKEKENSEFKPVRLCLKIDLVSHPAHSGGIG